MKRIDKINKTKIAKMLFIISLIVCCVFGCGNINKSAFLENVPDPETFFSESECSKYSLDKPDLKGIKVNYKGNDIRKDFESYIDACESENYWITPVYDGDNSWCCQNADETMQISINLKEDQNQIDICIKNLKGDE